MRNWFKCCILMLLTSGYNLQQLNSVAEDKILDLGDITLPALDEDYAVTNFTLNDVKRLLRAKCLKTGVDDVDIYDHIADGVAELKRCSDGLFNLTTIFAEIEAARPTGNMDVVFGKYCQRRGLVTQCFREFNVLLLPCLNAEERAQNYVILRIVYTLLEFFCHRNGDPMALFIAEEGPECLESHRQHIVECLNATFYGYLPQRGEEWLIEELPEFVLRPKQCGELYELEQCVLQHLERCTEATPSNMVEAVFRYVRNETKCQLEVERRQLAAAALFAETRAGAGKWRAGSLLLCLLLLTVVAWQSAYASALLVFGNG